jgi:hypothetical protein
MVIAAERFEDAFFQLHPRIASEITQKFAQCGLRVAIIGDISLHRGELVPASLHLRVEPRRSALVPRKYWGVQRAPRKSAHKCLKRFFRFEGYFAESECAAPICAKNPNVSVDCHVSTHFPARKRFMTIPGDTTNLFVGATPAYSPLCVP